ncbi:type II toxin-antitoxin system VapC family toxin [Kaistia hirudinis]|nr:type II toxin-antitoxin system VapC family toxin [Kaistia hirudinis]
MIVVDTSALMAICLGEPEGPACMQALQSASSLLISAGTLSEAMIVADGRGQFDALEALLEGLGPSIIPVTAETALRVRAAYRRWGKGRHPASLNLGDCFAYALAAERGCPLLFIGNDFARTDIVSAIA